jgi:hypothetical protein
VDKRLGRAITVNPTQSLGTRRGHVVQGLIVAMLVLSLLSTASNVEVWPFSPYRMYATMQGNTTSLLRLYGVADWATIDLGEIDNAPPFDGPRFQTAMRRLLSYPEQCGWLAAAARYGIDRFESLHPGALERSGTIRMVQLRELTWRLDGSESPVPMTNRLVCASVPAARGALR